MKQMLKNLENPCRGTWFLANCCTMEENAWSSSSQACNLLHFNQFISLKKLNSSSGKQHNNKFIIKYKMVLGIKQVPFRYP